MIYEVACPSCAQPFRSPFIRPGALWACPACGTKSRVAADQIKRTGGAPCTDTGSSVAEPGSRIDALLDAHAVAKRQDDTTASSPLPEPPAETAALHDNRIDPTPAPATGSDPTIVTTAAGRRTGEDASGRSRPGALQWGLLIGGGAAVLVALSLGIAKLSQPADPATPDDPAEAALEEPAEPSPAPGSPPAAVDPAPEPATEPAPDPVADSGAPDAPGTNGVDPEAVLPDATLPTDPGSTTAP
ncbi:MAG: hypothetical protein AAF612_09035 [Planctomycetota bacterium]